MFFDQRDDGDFRIFAGALEAAEGLGYIAAVVVRHIRNTPAPREVFRDEALSHGYRWASAELALSNAISKGREMVERARQPLAH